MKKFLHFTYWFNYYALPFGRTSWLIFAGLIICLFIAALIFNRLKQRSHLLTGMWTKLFDWSITNGLIGLFLFFFNYEQAHFFADRFWLLAWLLVMFVWLIMILSHLKRLPKIKKEIAAQELYRKYLPH